MSTGEWVASPVYLNPFNTGTVKYKTIRISDVFFKVVGLQNSTLVLFPKRPMYREIQSEGLFLATMHALNLRCRHIENSKGCNQVFIDSMSTSPYPLTK